MDIYTSTGTHFSETEKVRFVITNDWTS